MKRRLYPKPLLIGGKQVPPFTDGATRTDDGRWLVLYPHPIRDAEMFAAFHLDKAFEKWGMYLPEDTYTDTLNELIHHLWRMEEKFDPERNDSFENYARTYLPKRAADVGPRRILGRNGNRVNDYLHEELDADLQGPGLGQPFPGERGDGGFDRAEAPGQLPGERDRDHARYLDIIRLRDARGVAK